MFAFRRPVILIGLCVLLSLFAGSFKVGAQDGKKEEQKKEAKQDEAKKESKKDDVRKQDKDTSKDKKDEPKEEPKKEPFVLDTPLKELKGHKDWIFAMVVSSDGKLAATASRDGTVKIWE